MNAGMILFSALTLHALVVWVTAIVRTVVFLNRHKRAEQDVLNPVDGMKLWARLLARRGFGEAAERARQSILLNYAVGLGLFVVATVVFLITSSVPG